MKKLLLFLGICLITVSFNSCNDDNDDAYSDEIIGKWRLSQIHFYAEINNEPIDDEINEMFDEILTECMKKSTIDFSENGTYTENDFEFNYDSNTCEALQPTNGTWKNLGNSKYYISGIDFSDFDFPELTIELELKITFESDKMIMEFSATGDYEGDLVDILIKVTFIDNDSFVPDNIIGKWQLNQEFYNGEEEVLSECAKKMTIQFFEDGIYEEKDYSDETLECIAKEIKKGTWKNLGNNLYEISDIDFPEVKVTFEDNNNKMNVEFSEIVDGVNHTGKLIFIKVTTT